MENPMPVSTRSRKSVRKLSSTQNDPLLFPELFEFLIECLPVATFVCPSADPYTIHCVNPAIQVLAGYPPEAVSTQPDFWRSHIHPEDRSMVLEKLPEISGACTDPIEYRFLIADGTYKWFRERRKRMDDVQGGAYILGFWQDISHEKQLAMESEYRLQQVIQADKLASLGEVVAGVAHEINNPNSFITYNLPLLEETWLFLKPIITEFSEAHPRWQTAGLQIPELCQDMEEMIQSIRIGSDRITKVVSNLKDFARMDQSGLTRPVSVNEVIEKTLVIVGGQIRKAAAEITLDLASDLPEIQGHFMKLEQVVANLLLNAANAIPVKESGRISIGTRYIHRIQSVLIEVEDNGDGMKPGIMDRIFEPFFTTRRDTGGTGLGLSLSYGLIKEHSGRIGVHSKPGIGTRFTVYLPTGKDSHLDLRPTILCVDDEPAVLSMLRKYFISVENIPIETLTRSEEVLGYIENHPEVDIVISDIMMPEMNGWELLTLIKHRHPLMTVILFSGNPVQLTSKPDHTPAPDHLFSKPVPLKTLMETINTSGRQKL
jgi:PAS domain S-box-containing protein